MTTLNTVFGITIALIAIVFSFATLFFILVSLSWKNKFSKKSSSSESSIDSIRYRNRRRELAMKAATDFEMIKAWDTAG